MLRSPWTCLGLIAPLVACSQGTGPNATSATTAADNTRNDAATSRPAAEHDQPTGSPALTARVRAPAAPLTSFWNVEIGRRYTLDVVRRGNDWAWTGHIPMPHHHATRIDWLDLDKYPALDGAADGETRRFTFEIVDRESHQVPGRRQWRTTYRARVLAVDRRDPTAPIPNAPSGVRHTSNNFNNIK